MRWEGMSRSHFNKCLGGLAILFGVASVLPPEEKRVQQALNINASGSKLVQTVQAQEVGDYVDIKGYQLSSYRLLKEYEQKKIE